MTRGKVLNTNATQAHPPQDQAGSDSEISMECLRQAEALNRMMDIKKSYDYWQELVSKNVKSRLKSKKTLSADTETGDGSESQRNRASSFRQPTLKDLMTSEELALFSKPELELFRKKVSEKFAEQRGTHTNARDAEVNQILESCFSDPQFAQGFDPYGNEDEAGLHDENSGSLQLDLDRLEGQGFSDEESVNHKDNYHVSGPSRHRRFEVEVSDGPPGVEDDASEPSCEFTFEYDRDGKLIPTSSNIEEKLRLMNLQSQIHNEALSQASASAMAVASAAGGKKKKKGSKKKKKSKGGDDHCLRDDTKTNMCMLCQYEEFYGVRPTYSVRGIDYSHNWEMERRMGFREKLDAVKSRRARQDQSHNGAMLVDDSEDSHGTVEDD